MKSRKVVLALEAIKVLNRSGWRSLGFFDGVYRLQGLDNSISVIPSLPGIPSLMYLSDLRERTTGLHKQLEPLSFELLDGPNLQSSDYESEFEIIIGRGTSSRDDVQTLLSILSGLNRLSGGPGYVSRQIEGVRI